MLSTFPRRSCPTANVTFTSTSSGNPFGGPQNGERHRVARLVLGDQRCQFAEIFDFLTFEFGDGIARLDARDIGLCCPSPRVLPRRDRQTHSVPLGRLRLLVKFTPGSFCLRALTAALVIRFVPYNSTDLT